MKIHGFENKQTDSIQNAILSHIPRLMITLLSSMTGQQSFIKKLKAWEPNYVQFIDVLFVDQLVLKLCWCSTFP